MSLSIEHEAPLQVCDQHPRVVASLLERLLGGIVGAEKFSKIERLIMIEPATRIVPKLQILRDQARAEGHAEGHAAGRAEGEARGEAKALLKFLTVRGLRLTEPQRKRVLSCADPAQLERWIERAATAQSVSEVLGR